MPGDDVEKAAAPDMLDWRSRPSNRRRRRTVVLRLAVAMLALWTYFHFIVRQTESSSNERTLNIPGPVLTDIVVDLPHAENETKIQEVSDVPSDAAAPRNETSATGGTSEDDLLWAQRDLTDSLRRLFSLLPDELQAQNLLRPIVTTGKARLRDLGLRTRYFKELFEAWETVHLVQGEKGGALYIRDDLLQYMQRRPQLAATLNMTTAQAVRSYEAYRSVIARLSTLLFPWTAPYYPDHMHLHAQFYRAGRGLVYSAGDSQAPFLLTSIPVIRELGCDLPVEVMYLGDHDLSEDIRAKLEALPGVTTRDLSQMVDDSGWTLAGWAGKPFAILFSSFREVIFIDADSLFFQNPELLFEDEAYVATGALFFKDRLMMPELKKRWLQEVLPRPISHKAMETRLWTGESGHMQESGVVVVDKWKHLVALLLVTRMNGPDRDGNTAQRTIGVYDMVYGDKETFWLGWELAGDLDYEFHDGDAGIMGPLEKPKIVIPGNLVSPSPMDQEDAGQTLLPDNYTICAPQLLHLDRRGRPLWFNGWLLPNKFDNEKNREPTGFEAFLQEPREMREPGAWELRQNNVCCLTSEHRMEFTVEEREVLDLMVAVGRRVGALG